MIKSKHFAIALIFLLSCSKKEQFQIITIDYCSQQKFTTTPALSQQISSIRNLSDSLTGILPLEEGDVSMIHRAWLTGSAEKTIDIQYFIFSTDNIGLIASDYLLRAADRGIQVRVIVDDIMVEADADDLLALDVHPNLDIKIYNPAANVGKNFPEKIYSMASDFKGFNQRMHNKTFIVDGRVAITGGRNIADEYFDYDHEYNFRDRDVLLIGKAVQSINASFEEFWNHPLSVPITEVVDSEDYKLNTEVKYNFLHQYSCNPENFWPQVRERINAMPQVFQTNLDSGLIVWSDSVGFVSDNPGKNDEEALIGSGVSTDTLINLIRRAKHSIEIQSPYLITTDVGQKLFNEVTKHGVSVNILTNSLASTDNLEAFNGYQRDRDKLLKAGVNIFEFKPDAAVRLKLLTGALQHKLNYKPRFGLHAKTMVIDGAVAIIGTFNLDPRSANLNTECISIIRNKQIAAQVLSAMTEDRKPENAWHTTQESNPDSEAGWSKRTQAWFRGLVPKKVL